MNFLIGESLLDQAKQKAKFIILRQAKIPQNKKTVKLENSYQNFPNKPDKCQTVTTTVTKQSEF